MTHASRTTSDELNFGEFEITILVVEDGTRTVAEANMDGEVLAQAEARRRKGDKRNRNVGTGLAVSRLFDKLADLERGELKRIGH